MINVRLNESDIKWARAIGATRQWNAQCKNYKDKHGATGGLAIHMLGALGEIAVARAIGVKWQPTAGKFQELGADGVGPFEIRTAGKHHLSLIIRDSDDPERLYILVTTEDQVNFEVKGWMIGKFAREHPEWRRAPGGREEAWFVPQSALVDMRFLPRYKTDNDHEAA